MATWVIGDVQGCWGALKRLLGKLQFDPEADRLWFAGDLIGRGVQAEAVLDFVMGLGDRASCVLGNHDLNLLAIDAGLRRAKPSDRLDGILASSRRADYMAFLSRQPLILWSDKHDTLVSHAGLYPKWSIAKASALAEEVVCVLRSSRRVSFLENMYGDTPDIWSEHLTGWARLRFIANAFTRMRFVDGAGRLDLATKGGLESAARPWRPWFDWPNPDRGDTRVIFGHWSTVGRIKKNNVVGLDSGCVWGGELSAIQIDRDHDNIVAEPCKSLTDELS